jgi:hypothetical protein
MPTCSREKCRLCAKLSAQQAQQLHGLEGYGCWIPQRCYKGGVAGIGLTQEASPTPATPQTTTASPQQPSNSKSITSDGVFFADILVRGQPVFHNYQ